tara:strand:+ start:126 stop:431 length:306 start_codon:yes stop_codon:yes gene_type:complete
MKSKFKDILLYSLACVGAISLFISATNSQSTMDVNIVSLNGTPINTWCSNSDCSVVEIIPTKDFNGGLNSINGGLNSVKYELDNIKDELQDVLKLLRYKLK